MPEGARAVGDRLQVAGPVGEHEAVPAPGECRRDVGDDLQVALATGDQVLVDDGHPARCGRAGVPAVPVGRRVEAKHRRGPRAGGAAGQHVRAVGGLPGQGDGVADRADLHGDEVVELVAPVGVAVRPSHRRARICRTASSNAAAGTWWHSSATISPYEAVSSAMSSRRASVCNVITSTVPPSLARPPPSCPALTPRNSLIRARHWWASALRSTRTSAETWWAAMTAQAIRLARPRRGDQYPQVVPGQFRDRVPLHGSERRGAGEVLAATWGAVVGDIQAASGL